MRYILEIIAGKMLLKIHKQGLCKPFHRTKEQMRYDVRRGKCPVLSLAYEIFDDRNLPL